MKMKFELTDKFIINDFGVKLYRIKALKDFGDVNVGDFGGYAVSYTHLTLPTKA